MEEQKNETAGVIPYIVHEAEMARQERHTRRLWMLCILAIAMLVGTNLAWLAYEMQFEDVRMEQSVSSDGAGDVTLNGIGSGELNYYGGESNANNKNQTP